MVHQAYGLDQNSDLQSDWRICSKFWGAVDQNGNICTGFENKSPPERETLSCIAPFCIVRWDP